MRAFIVGCGRVGAGLAERLAAAGHDVTIIDITSEAFARLETDFPGRALRGDGTDEDVLRRAGAEGCDLFVALTQGDNRNILAAQLAAETLGVRQVVAKVNDPVRAQAYTALGITTLCRTRLLIDAVATYAGLPADPGAPGVSPATGHHPSGPHAPSAPSAPEPSASIAPAPAPATSSAPPAPEPSAPSAPKSSTQTASRS